MRESLRERRYQLHRGFPVPRMLTMLLLLVIVGMLFMRLRDPNTFRFFAANSDDREAAKGATTGIVAAKPADSAKAVPVPALHSPAAHVPEPGRGAAAPVPAGTGASPAGPPSDGTIAADSASKPSTAPPPELTATGPTDLDPEEREDVDQWRKLFYDGSLQTMPAEQPALYRVLGWVDHQPTELLRKRAIRDILYDSFLRSPDTMRFQIVELKFNIRQVVRIYDKFKDGKPQPMRSPEGKELFEVHGTTPEGGSNLYFADVTDLPPEIPIGTNINVEARLVGYFFKVQGYISLQQQLEAEEMRRKIGKPLKAPMFIGRLIWQPSAPLVEQSTTPTWAIATIGGFAIIVVIGWVCWYSRRPARTPLRRFVAPISNDPDAPSVDSWLDRAQSGRPDFDPDAESVDLDAPAPEWVAGGRFSGNIFDDIGESNSGSSSLNGHSGNGHRKNGSSGSEPEVRENDNPSG